MNNADRRRKRSNVRRRERFPMGGVYHALSKCKRGRGSESESETLEKIKKLGTNISSLTLEEARFLINYFQDKLDVSTTALASAAVMAVAPGAGEASLLWRRRRSSMWRRKWRGGWGNGLGVVWHWV
ncbi:hypothetical protein ACFX12_030638 [Malus domestica]